MLLIKMFIDKDLTFRKREGMRSWCFTENVCLREKKHGCLCKAVEASSATELYLYHSSPSVTNMILHSLKSLVRLLFVSHSYLLFLWPLVEVWQECTFDQEETRCSLGYFNKSEGRKRSLLDSVRKLCQCIRVCLRWVKKQPFGF